MEYKNIMKSWIEILTCILDENINNYELTDWVKNCIDALQFALNNENIIEENINLYNDLINIINMLHSWIIEKEDYMYISLRQKFKSVYTAEQVGQSLKCMLNKIEQYKNQEGSYML